MSEFLPILLGTDSNVYGMARSFYEEYGVVSHAIGKGNLAETRYSKIVNVTTLPNFDEDEVFVKYLLETAKNYKHQYKYLFLISCGDRYAELVIKNKNKLKKDYIIPTIEEELREKLETKASFYEICKQYNLEIPKTIICNSKNIDNIKIPFSFPVALKPSDSISYAECNFVGKKKCYKIDDEKELLEVISNIFKSGYKDNLIIQEYIPGDSSSMFVLNAYSNKNSKVKMMCLGKCVIEDCTPKNIGNYDALISCGNKEIYENVKQFLEKINYVGYSNFDFKYDERDNKYKLFEINIRQGRSSYFTTAAGCNLAKLLVDDYINNDESDDCLYNYNEWLWLNVNLSTVKKFIKNKFLLNRVKKLVKQKKYCYTLLYNKDLSLKRILNVIYIYNFKKKDHSKYSEVNNK